MSYGFTTAIWPPTILGSGPGFGVQSNGFGFTISWVIDSDVIVDACTDLANSDWQPIQTNTLFGGLAYFSDPEWTNYPTRFYRVRWP